MYTELWSENIKRTDHRPLGITRHRWEDNIKMDYREEGCESTDSTDSNRV
jgi:hypothetical protein